MATTITDHDSAARYEVHVDEALAGFADRSRTDGTMVLPHTVVEPRFQGQGLAAQLVRRALDDARAEGLSVAPVCSYVAHFLHRHPDDLDLVPEAERARYGL
ncbi:MAG: GNAT family N-acetyltransferase [Iamia sp.]